MNHRKRTKSPFYSFYSRFFRPQNRALSSSRLSSSMNMSMTAGIFGMFWLTTYIPGNILNVFFKNHLGSSAFLLGLMVAIIHFTNIFHLIEIPIYGKLKSKKLYFYIMHTIHRLLGFIPALVTLYIIHGGDRNKGIIIITASLTLSFMFSNTSSSGWYAWMSDIIPENIRATFFGRRVAINNASSMVWFFFVMLALDVFNKNILTVFTVVFILAGIGGFLDIFLHLFIPEQRSEAPTEKFTRSNFLEPLKSKNFRSFVFSYALYMFSTNILAPFLAPYLTAKDGIGAPNVWLGILVVNTQFATIATLSHWGIIMDRFGRKPVVLLGSLSYVTGIGWFFLTSQNYAYIIPVIALISGLLAPVFIEGTNQLMLTITPQKNKTTFISWFMASVGIANGLGSLTGGILYDLTQHFHMVLWGWFTMESFHIVVLVNLALCSVSFLILTRIREGGEKPVGFVVSRLATPGIIKTFSNMSIIGKAKSSDRVARALRELEGVSGTLAVTDVLKRLDDPAVEVRKEAAEALGRIKSADAIDALINRLCDPNSSIRPEAALALGHIGDDKAIPALIKGIDSSSEELQEACIQAIGQIGEPESVKWLLELLKQDRTERVITTSATAVSRHGLLEAAWEILPRMQKTQNPVLRKQLAIAFGNLLGKPGEFYHFVSSENSQSNQIGKLFNQITRSVLRLEKQLNPSKKHILSKDMTMIRKLVDNDSYAAAIKKLYSFIKRLIILMAHNNIADDEALLYYAIYRDTRLGLAFWFIKQVRDELPHLKDPEILKLDVLLALYFLSSYNVQDKQD